jgi:hypothetical protein
MRTAGEWYFTASATSSLWYEAQPLIFPGAEFGRTVTSDFSLGAGMTMIGAAAPMLYIAPRVRLLSTNRFDVGLGARVMGAPGDFAFGQFYVTGTFGTEVASLTASAQNRFNGGELGDTPVVMIGGELRMSPGVGLITENYFLREGGRGTQSLGLRFMGETLSVDFAFYRANGYMGSYLFPFVGFAANF